MRLNGWRRLWLLLTVLWLLFGVGVAKQQMSEGERTFIIAFFIAAPIAAYLVAWGIAWVRRGFSER